MTLFVPVECNENHGLNNYSECYLESLVREKKQIRITINENHEENRKKLEVIRQEALKLKYFTDTSTVIQITLSDSVSYGEFVFIVDMCETDGHKRYGWWDNKFVIFGEWAKKEIKVVDTLPLLMCGYIPIKKGEQKQSFIQKVIKNIKNNYTQQGLYLSIGFLILLISYLYSRKAINNSRN